MTTPDLLRDLSEFPWFAFLVFWGVSALRTRPTKRSESFLSRYGVMLILVTGFVFIFDGDTKIGVLGRRFLRPSLSLSAFAIALVWIGIGLAIWARVHLGQNWSGRATIKEGHELIRTGPYAHLRHPIYSGLLLAIAGSVLQIAEWRCLAGMALVTCGFSIKAKKEESMLRGEFGASFEEHRRHTGFLLPRFR